MNLTSEMREQVRLSLLRYGLDPSGFSLALARNYLKAEGWRSVTDLEVQAEINYLAHPQKGFLESQKKAVSPEVARYVTTPNGRDYLAGEKEEAS